jgi:c(7)-type cytochrome triheme protein
MTERTVIRIFWRAAFITIIILGLWAAMVRFTQGLGAATNLSDEFPWGLWVGFDILVGVGLAAGGFVIAATVHIFNIKRYEPIARPAVLTAFLGYLLVIVALGFDLGRPYRIWHPLVMGNPHSVMFEVAMCVMLYTMVLALEFSPLVFKRLGMHTPLKVVRALYIPIVILGVILSTLHQSSLGTLYVIVPDKLHPLWYTPLLPVFFFLSAVAGGLAMTIFESFLSYRAFGRRLEPELLRGIGRVMVVVLSVLLVWKVMNLHDRGALHYAFEPGTEAVMFWGEMLLGVTLPMVLLMMKRVRHSNSGLFFAAMLTIMGFIVGRLNIAITGVAAASGVNYIPSWMEFVVTAAIVAVGFALFGAAVRHLEVFPKEEAETVSAAPAPAPRPVFAGRALAGLWGFLIVGFVLVAFTGQLRSRSSSTSAGDDSEVLATPTVGWSDMTIPDDIALPQSEDSPGEVYFNHSSHVDLDAPACGGCHGGTFSLMGKDSPRADYRGLDLHDRQHCGRCHDGEEAFDLEEDCEACHTP